MAEETTNQIDALTSKYTAGFEKFSKTQSGNVVLDFISFKRNLVPHTLLIIFVLGVVAAWIVAVLGILGQGPIGDCCREMVEKDGKTVMSLNFIKALGYSVGTFVFAPFVLHYLLELCKFAWKFVAHVYEKVLVPIWNTLVVCFLANVAPQVLPFLYQRFMKAVDILMSKLDPLLDALIGIIVSAAMTLIAVVKGCVWFPKKVCQCFEKWIDKPAKEEPAREETPKAEDKE